MIRVRATSRSVRRRRLRYELLEDRRLLASLSDLTLDPASHSLTSLIVQFRDGTSSAGSLAAHLATDEISDEWSIAPGLRRVELDADADWSQTLAAYQNDPNVLFAQPDHRVSLQLAPGNPEFSQLWGLDNVGQTNGTVDADIDAPEAWNVTTGSSDTIVAVIDTGVDYNHQDLAANMWTNDDTPGNRIDDDGNGYVDDVHGYDFVNRDGNPMDDHYHGTHVAGTIGAVGDDDSGVAGVNWHVRIMALKFLDENGSGYESDAIAALNYAVANGAKISNNSWGGGPSSPAMIAALQNARAKGHIFVAAAGNDGWDNDLDAFYPASYAVDNVVSVGATDHNDELSWFSNFGLTSVDLTAPGEDIYSTSPGNSYRTLSGTSMATPHVAGVMALVLAVHPTWDYSQVIDQVLNTVDLTDGAFKTFTGGRLNAAAAVNAPDTNGPRVITTDPSGSHVGTLNHIRLSFSETIDPATISLDDIVSFTGPGPDDTRIPIPVLSVDPVAGSARQFDVTFESQTALGTYLLVLGANISDLVGNLVDQDRDGNFGEDPDDSFTATIEISDIAVFGSTVDVDIDVLDYLFFGPVESTVTVGPNVTISDINVQLEIYYPNVDELKIYVESPAGTRVTLLRLYEGYGDNFVGTTFDDEAPTPIGNGTWPYVEEYRPSSPLSAFDGENAAGTWTLFIEAHLNDFLAGEGFLDGWSIEIEGDGSGGDPPPPPPPPPSDPPPGNRPPVAEDDALDGEVNTTLAITAAELLANDTDPDRDVLSIAFVGSPVGGSVGIGANELIIFTPEDDFTGQASFQYIVTDGFALDIGTVTIDFASRFQFHNSALPGDVDKDGEVTPQDALTIINLLNAIGPSPFVSLSSDAEPEAYLDVMPDNQLSPDDALAIINAINAQPATLSLTNSTAATPRNDGASTTDVALLSLLLEHRSKK